MAHGQCQRGRLRASSSSVIAWFSAVRRTLRGLLCSVIFPSEDLTTPVFDVHYFTKYQVSGVMDNVGDCGVTPLRLFATSVS
jgi:hypothetical protein